MITPSRPEGVSYDIPDVAPEETALGLSTPLVELLPFGVYVCDAQGTIVRWNRAAARLWGRDPQSGGPATRFCGAVRLYRPSGAPVAHASSPMAVALATGIAFSDEELLLERPDGSKVEIALQVEVLRRADGAVAGAVGAFRERRHADQTAQRLAAIVENSDDAILTKDLDGIITSWNRGAERLYGYTAEETIGRPVSMLIPLDRQDEEPSILARIRRGERIEHFDTIRRRKDGSLVDISLSVSPLRNARGEIVGASKIARDVTEHRRAQEQQRLLLREMNHRVKNLFALAGSIVMLSARTAETPKALAQAATERLAALARAHALTQPSGASGEAERPTTLHALVRTILSPYDPAESRVTVSGADPTLAGHALTGLALLLHEFATNASKYGALSTPEGRVDVACAEAGEQLLVTWTERGGPPVEGEAGAEGFGTMLARATVKGQLGGSIERDWQPEGLVIRLSVARERLGG